MPGTYIIEWVFTDSGNNQTSQSQIVRITNAAPTAIAQDITVELNENGIAIISPEMIDNGSYDDCEIQSFALDITEFSEDNIGENTVTLTVTDNAGNTSEVKAEVTVLQPFKDFLFPNFISPDGNGKNDKWEIIGLERLQGYMLSIFNKIGELVYTSDAYDNSWDATFSGEILPDGTYYYIFKKDDSVFKGFISVIR